MLQAGRETQALILQSITMGRISQRSLSAILTFLARASPVRCPGSTSKELVNLFEASAGGQAKGGQGWGKGFFITSGEFVNKRQKFTKWKDSQNF
jgi:hypothetical protein